MRMKDLIGAVAILALSASLATAQPWSYNDTWNGPQTTAIRLVKAALDRGLCEQAGVDYIKALGYPAVAVSAGQASPAFTIVWYGKGEQCVGKYQYVSPDGPYLQGWEISFDSNSWVDDPTSPIPPGFSSHHPTKWRIVAFGSGNPINADPLSPPQIPGPPVQAPPPVVTPPVVTSPAPQPPPVVTPPLTIDIAAIIAELKRIEDQNDANTKTIVDAVNEPGWLKKVVSSPTFQVISAAVASWVTAKVTAK